MRLNQGKSLKNLGKNHILIVWQFSLFSHLLLFRGQQVGNAFDRDGRGNKTSDHFGRMFYRLQYTITREFKSGRGVAPREGGCLRDTRRRVCCSSGKERARSAMERWSVRILRGIFGASLPAVLPCRRRSRIGS